MDLSAVNELKMEENEFEVYPNPASNQLNIRLHNTNTAILSLTLFDVSGRTVLHKTEFSGNKNDYQVNIDHLNNGLYLLKINSVEKTITKRIILKNN